ncbi:ester cyclase [Vitiosangium sp. GDMCC 1.1324]|uniref:ester cyclase n=1 Tax=Vitiosangium sp. (strain GDMCC 1.1324) TaxID=2138576 RepID=UPI000D3B8049|nr:ester cyclase [Vitiosangium sp. GDMCC 1.1324]PTL76770.1 ester cyclase [Vitiosangium sp. GDMCC 1.1324]
MANLKQAARRLVEEVYGQGRVEVLDELCHPGYVGHDPLVGDADLSGVKAYVRLLRACFPNLEARILGLYVDGDTTITWWRMEGNLARRLLDVEPRGQRVRMEGITLSQFEDGKLVEDMSEWDTFGYLQQLGLVQPLGSLGRPSEAGDIPETSQA